MSNAKKEGVFVRLMRVGHEYNKERIQKKYEHSKKRQL